MYIFSKSRFNAAVKRLREALPFKSIVNDVIHQIQKDGNRTLANDLSCHFDKYPTSRGLDRKRAENALAQALNNEDYNILSAKLKKQDENAVDMEQLMLHHTHEFKNTCFSLSSKGDAQRNTILYQLDTLANEKAEKPLPTNQFDMSSDEHTEASFWGLFSNLVHVVGIRTLTTLGAADVVSDTLEGDEVDIDLFITFNNDIELHANFVADKINGEIESLTTTLFLNGKELYEYLADSDDEAICESFKELAHFFCVLPSEADLVDTKAPYYRSIASFVIPAMQYAASNR